MIHFSVIVPVLNEAASLVALLSEIDSAAKQMHDRSESGPAQSPVSAGATTKGASGKINSLDPAEGLMKPGGPSGFGNPAYGSHEVIFVDDGSTDASWSVISELAVKYEHVSGIRFRKNFGKAAALRAGIERAQGQLIVTMDADLQDDPAEIPQLINTLGDDLDLVSGWKKERKDPLGKRLPSKVFNWLVSWLTGVSLHDHNCGFKVYRREVFDEVKLYGEMHRFIPVLASSRGFAVGEMAVNHRARKHGHSKYGWSRLPKGFLDLMTVSFLTGFNQRPQHLLGSVGGLSFVFGSAGLLWMAIYWVLRMTLFGDWEPLHQRPVVIYSVAAMLLGAQLLSMGFLAELIIARGQERESPFSIRESVPPLTASVSVHENSDRALDAKNRAV